LTSTKYPGWTVIKELGEGGQGQTFLATKFDFEASLSSLAQSVAQANAAKHTPQAYDMQQALAQFRAGLTAFLSDDKGRGLGVIKVLKPRKGESDSAAKAKMRGEAEAYRRVAHPNLLRLLEEHVDDGYIVTEYQPGKTLGQRLDSYTGRAQRALDDLTPLIEAVVALHAQNVIHRDIKPENIFVSDDGGLILGDAGVAFFADNEETRKTNTFSNVGTHAFMPLWAHDHRVEEVAPSFDVYSLAKVLWCMVAGQPKLLHYYFTKEEYNLEKRFPSQPEMKSINALLGRALVQFPEDVKDETVAEFLASVKQTRADISGGPEILIDPRAERTCGVCRRGVYKQTTLSRAGLSGSNPDVWVFNCNHCGHVQVFRGGTAMWQNDEK
jgi:serine/threonine protein kinase